MRTSSANNLNTRIALGLGIGGAVLFLALLILLSLIPEKTLVLIDNANIKALLLALGSLTLTAIGILLYWAFYIPTARRLTAVGWRAVLVYSAVSGGFSVFGWPRIRSMNLNEQTGFNAVFAPFEASLEVWPNLAVCFAGIAVMTAFYQLVGVLEARYGKDFY